MDLHCRNWSRRPGSTSRWRARAHGALIAGPAILGAVAIGLLSPALIGCGGPGTEVPTQPFGTPPSAAPGIHAWAAGEVGTLLVTADGGATWRRQRFYLPERGVDVAFPDARSGWVITDAGAVLLSGDGGSRWTVVAKDNLQMKAIAATDLEHAWVAGSTETAAGGPGQAVLLSTADGGDTWKRMRFGDAQLADVAFSDTKHGVLVALDRIWSTSDGGRSWKLRRQVPLTVLTSACAGDPQHAWVAGWDTQSGAPLVFATRDGGATWRRLGIDVPAPAPGALQAGQIVAAGAGTGATGAQTAGASMSTAGVSTSPVAGASTSPVAAAGAASAQAAGATRLWLTCPAGVLASQDGGRSWTLQKVAAGRPQAIGAGDEQHLLATTTGQPILATADGGATWLAWGRNGYLGQPLMAVAVVAGPAQQ